MVRRSWYRNFLRALLMLNLRLVACRFPPTCGYNLGDINLVLMVDSIVPRPDSTCPLIDSLDSTFYATQAEAMLAFIYGVQMTEASAYIIRDINARTDLLPNVTLGFVAAETCFSHLATVAQFTNLISAPELVTDEAVSDSVACREVSLGTQRLVGVLGLYNSDQAKHVTSLGDVYNLPILSDSASAQDLSDKSKFQYFSRVMSSSERLIEAALDFVQQNEWTYISFVYMDGSWGEGAAKVIKRSADRRGMCFAVFEVIGTFSTQEETEEIARRLALKPNARVVITVMIAPFVQRLLTALEDHPDFKPIWLGMDFNPADFGMVAYSGSFIFTDTWLPVPQFEAYLRALNPSPNGHGNRWLPLFWETLFSCTWNPLMNINITPCAIFKNATLPDGLQILPSSRRIEGVQAYAHALHALIEDNCPWIFNRVVKIKTEVYDCVKHSNLLKHLRAVDFEGVNGPVIFDENGDRLGNVLIFQYLHKQGVDSGIPVAMYGSRDSKLTMYEEMVDWNIFSEIYEDQGKPDSVCSQPCKDKEYAVPLEERCCWECRNCRPNEKLNENKTNCITCPLLTWPDEEQAMLCETIQPTFTRITENLGLALLAVAILGILLDLATFAWFTKNKSEKLIKASSRELSTFIFIGILLAFVIVILFLLKPSEVTCQLRISGFHISVALIFAPLFVKSNRIYRIFTAGKKGGGTPTMIQNKIQVFFTLCLLLVQVIITTFVWLLMKSMPEYRMPIITDRFVELNCSLPLGALLPGLVFNLMLLSSCAVYGYLTRKLPENFNESWYIFVSVATTLFLWMVFIPAYFTAFYASHQVVLLCCCLFFNAYITMICLFWPKVYAVKAKRHDKINDTNTTNSTVATVVVN